MKKVLIAYATKSGSTAEAAEFIGHELTQKGFEVEVKPIREVKDMRGFDSVIVGGPMMMGWHSEAVNFLKRNQQNFHNKEVACFALAMSLTKAADSFVFPAPVFQDAALVKPPKDPARLSFKEKFTRVSNYIKPMFSKSFKVKPNKVAFFAGKVDLSKLNVFEILFVLLVVGATPGDYRNWDSVREWAAGL